MKNSSQRPASRKPSGFAPILGTLLLPAFLAFVPMARADVTEADFKRADADLNRTYKETLGGITTPGTRDALVKSQRAWLVYRDSEAAFRAGTSSGGASAYSKDLLAALTALTQQRTQDLVALSKPASKGSNSESGGASASAIIPKNWAPDLSSVTSYFNDALGEAKAQSEINSLSRSLADSKDAALFIVYANLYQRLDEAGRAELAREQAQWLEQRDRKSSAAVESKGGSLAAFESNQAEGKLTEARIQQLTKRLEGRRSK